QPLRGRLAARLRGPPEEATADRAARLPRRERQHAHGDLVLRDAAVTRAPLEPAAPPTRHFEVPAERLLQDWQGAHARARAYAAALGLEAAEAERLAEPWEDGADAATETLRALRTLVLERHPRAATDLAGLEPFLAWRLDRLLTGETPRDVPGPRPRHVPVRDGALRSAPALSRRSMTSEPIEHHLLR